MNELKLGFSVDKWFMFYDGLVYGNKDTSIQSRIYNKVQIIIFRTVK